MSTLKSGKIAEVMFENAMDEYNAQTMLLDKTDVFKPESSTMQNAGNTIWRSVEQHAPIIDGWDLTGLEQPIIEETYPSFLGTPKNDFPQQRIDDLRDMTFWERRGRKSGEQQMSELNKGLANLIALQGSLFYRTDAVSGYNAIAEGQAIMNERQGSGMNRCVVLNDRDTLKYGSDLAGRQTLQGRPESTWNTGQIGQNVAEFDVYTGSFLPNLPGGPDPATTVTADQSFAPTAGTVDPLTNAVTNTDYREATIPVADSSGYNVGDKVTFANGGVTVNAVGLGDKTDTKQAMTFTIARIDDANSVVIYPKPIALDDTNLNLTEQSYANVDTQILTGATMNRINIDVSAKTNLFWEKEAVEVIGGDIPANLMSEFDGKKVISETMDNGINMYMIYDAELVGMTLRYRLFTWYGLTMKDPKRAGCWVTF